MSELDRILARILACVNACEGIPTEELERCKLRLRLTKNQPPPDPGGYDIKLRLLFAIKDLLEFGSKEQDVLEYQELIKKLHWALVRDYGVCLKDGTFQPYEGEVPT